MKNKNLFYFVNFLLLIISCQTEDDGIEKNENKLNPIEIINNKIDINNDNISDFEITEIETATLDIPSSYGLIEKRLIPFNDFELLTDNNWELITLKPGDTIKKNDFENKAFLKPSPLTLLKKERNFDVYDKKWSINQGAYAGFKNETEIGWLLFDLNIETGNITIINHKISKDDYIIIN